MEIDQQVTDGGIRKKLDCAIFALVRIAHRLDSPDIASLVDLSSLRVKR